MKSYSFRGLLALATILTPLTVSAAIDGASTLPGVVDREINDVNVPKEYRLKTPKKSAIKEEPTLEKMVNQQGTITLSAINFQGNTVIATSELQRIAAPYLNRPLDKDELAKLKYQLNKAFYDKGYILVKVVTPPQNLADGTLNVDVYEAKVGSINLPQDSQVVNSTIVDAMTQRLEQGEVFHEADAESAISDLNSLHNVEATLNLAPGSTFGTTDLNFLLNEINDNVQEFTLDNYGNSLTGTGVASLHLEHGNLLGLGEKYFTDLRRSDDDLWSTNVGFDSPTGLWNTHLQLQYLHSENDIGDRLANLNAEGKTNMVSAALTSDILHTRSQKISLSTGVEVRAHKSYVADILSTRDNITEAFLRAVYLIRTNEAVYFLSTRISTGLDAFNADDEGHTLASNALGDPDAWRIEPLLYANILSPFSDGSFIINTSGQLASGDLFSSDLFVLGGYGSVRGFDSAQVTGESGYQFSLEYNHNLPELIAGVEIKAGPFVDFGAAHSRVNSGLNTYDSLFSAGLGLQAEADLIDAGATILRIDWAHPLSSYTQEDPLTGVTSKDTTISSDTLYVRVTQEF